MARHLSDDVTGANTALGLARTITLREGVLGLIAVGLVAFLCAVFWAKFPAIEANQVRILEAQKTANVAMSSFAAEHRQIETERTAILTAQVRLLQLLCTGQAKNDADRRECSLAFPARQQ
jgi:hypothetical protein